MHKDVDSENLCAKYFFLSKCRYQVSKSCLRAFWIRFCRRVHPKSSFFFEHRDDDPQTKMQGRFAISRNSTSLPGSLFRAPSLRPAASSSSTWNVATCCNLPSTVRLISWRTIITRGQLAAACLWLYVLQPRKGTSFYKPPDNWILHAIQGVPRFFVHSFNSQSQGLEHYKYRRLGTCSLVTRLRTNRRTPISLFSTLLECRWRASPCFTLLHTACYGASLPVHRVTLDAWDYTKNASRFRIKFNLRWK